VTPSPKLALASIHPRLAFHLDFRFPLEESQYLYAWFTIVPSRNDWSNPSRSSAPGILSSGFPGIFVGVWLLIEAEEQRRGA